MKYYWLLPISSNSWLKYAQVICLQDLNFQMAFQVLSRKESSCQGRKPRRRRFNPWVEKMPCKRKWQPAPIFLPKKFHRQRSWWATVMGWQKSDMTEQLSLNTTSAYSKLCVYVWKKDRQTDRDIPSVLISTHVSSCAVLFLVTQSCLTLCDHMDYSPPVSSVHEESPGENAGVGCHDLLQGIFPTQVSHVAGGFFTVWATREARVSSQSLIILQLYFHVREICFKNSQFETNYENSKNF